MKNTFIIIGKIVLGIIFIIVPYVLISLLFVDILKIEDAMLLKWIPLLICMIGFYVSGLINKKTPLILLLLLYISLVVFIPFHCFYFPFLYWLILFATISLALSRKEISKRIKSILGLIMGGIFVFFLFSQPLVIVKWGYPERYDEYGKLMDTKVIWDFSKKEPEIIPETIFLDVDDNEIDLKSFKGKTLYLDFWATWCKPCLKQKPELEKLKEHFKNNSNIVFIDISVNDDKNRWKQYIKTHHQAGLQLISKNPENTRRLLGIMGIPKQMVVNEKQEYVRETGTIENGYRLLSDANYLQKFITKELPKRTKWSDYLKKYKQDSINKLKE